MHTPSWTKKNSTFSANESIKQNPLLKRRGVTPLIMLQITNSKDITFNVRIILKGDKYGIRHFLTHEEDKPLVEFFDARYDVTEDENGKKMGIGQFISRYYLKTLQEREPAGLDLCGDVTAWEVSKKNMDKILEYAEKFMKENFVNDEEWISNGQFFFNLRIGIYAHHQKQNHGAAVCDDTKRILYQGSPEEVSKFIQFKTKEIQNKVEKALKTWRVNHRLYTFEGKVSKKELIRLCDGKECFTIYKGGRTKVNKLLKKSEYLMNADSKLEFKASEITFHGDHFEIFGNKYYISQ